MTGPEKYPRMLYQPALTIKDAGINKFDHMEVALETRLVNSDDEEIDALKGGWFHGPSEAAEVARERARQAGRVEFLVTNWQYWITTMIAFASLLTAIASSAIAYMAFKRL